MAVVNVNSNGQAPKGLSAGTTVRTAGGDYKITSVRSDGSYVSQKVTSGSSGSSAVAAVNNAISQNSSTASRSAALTTVNAQSQGVRVTEPWQQNMVNVKSQGTVAIQSEINRAQAIINAGQGTVSTQRYLSQMNAMLAGKPIGEIFRGDWDNYSSVSQTNGNWNAEKNAENTAAAEEAEYLRKLAERYGGATGGSGNYQGGYGADAAPYDDPYDNRTVKEAIGQGMAQVVPDFSGIANTGIMVIAGAAALMAVAKLFGK